MIFSPSQILLLIASGGLIVTVWQLIQRNKLRPAYALLWLLISASIFILALFRGIIPTLAVMFGVDYPPSILFAAAIFFLVILLLFQTVVLSSLAQKSTELAERVAILQWKIDKLEERLALYQISSHVSPDQPSDILSNVIATHQEDRVYS